MKRTHDFQFPVQQIKSLEVIIPILTTQKKLTKLKIKDSSCFHQRIGVRGQMQTWELERQAHAENRSLLGAEAAASSW